jgi:hypothetical protein
MRSMAWRALSISPYQNVQLALRITLAGSAPPHALLVLETDGSCSPRHQAYI